jgi:hypothetical protein
MSTPAAGQLLDLCSDAAALTNQPNLHHSHVLRTFLGASRVQQGVHAF